MSDTRKSECSRKTNETDVAVSVELASCGSVNIASGVPFLDHMLSSFARHGRFGLSVVCKGDTHIDDHHSVEDIGICLGSAVSSALGDKKGICRFGEAVIPMDDALALASVDLSGRGHFAYKGTELRGYIGRYSEELTVEFLRAFCVNGGMNLHLQILDGSNRHHIHEAAFKAVGIALYKAVLIDPLLGGGILSTKGVI
ncbi:MAG: imidazoleglycerol-phosphate dehydratase HisB [Spirochaetia bacterium]|jgi:imidazoleglycerol-phosphate dehydratase|nr:imidazoleglycerol-phosphate dehydratase HisB [Spirochaetia bacterium]